MANQAAVAAFFLFVLGVFSNFELSASTLVLGKVSCLDCHNDFDFSGLLFLLVMSHLDFQCISSHLMFYLAFNLTGSIISEG